MGTDAEATWAKRVERWADSGLTAREFAAETGINANTLVHWKWRLRGGGKRRQERPRATLPSTALAFVEVTAPPPARVISAPPVMATPPSAVAAPAPATASPPPRPPMFEPLEIVLGGGLRIRIPIGGFDPELLRRVVAALEGC